MKSGLLIVIAALMTNLSSLPAAHADEINAQEIMRHSDVGVAIVTVTDRGTGADDQINPDAINQAGNDNNLSYVASTGTAPVLLVTDHNPQ